MPGRISCPTLVGREGEFQRVTALLEDASGTRPLVLITGEAGIGKSRLLGAILAAQRARGAVVLAGSCIPIAGRALPYGPVLDALRPRRDAPGSAALTDLRRDLRAALQLAAPDQERQGTGPAGQARVFEAVIEALERASEHCELVVSIEDLHWADAATRDLLSFLVPSRWSSRVSLIATVRTDEPAGVLRPMLTELDRSRQVARIDLQPLAPDAVREVVAGILDAAPTEAVAEEIARRSGGNPFFVEELVAAARGGEARLPPNLGEILLARVASLPEPVQQLLRYMAVIGERASDALLAAVTEEDAGSLARQLRTAIESHVVRADGPDGFTFRHALVREALYADLLPRERRAMHERVARTLAEPDGEPLVPPRARTIALALHWDEAGQSEQALPALVEAAAVALASHAYADAVTLYRRAIERWHEHPSAEDSLVPELVMLYEYAADAAYLADDTAAAIELVREAISLHDASRDAMRAAILNQHLCEYLWQHGLEEECLETTRRAFELAPRDGSRERAVVVGAWASALTVMSQYAEALEVVEEAVRIGRALQDDGATGWSLAVRGLSRSNLRDVAAGMADLAEARELARRSGDLDAQAIVYLDAAWATAMIANDLDTALEMVAEWEELQRQAGLERSRGMWMAGVHGSLRIRRGEWDVATGAVEAALRRPSRGPVRLELLHIAAQLATWQGRLDEADELVNEAIGVVSTMVCQQMIGPAYAAAVELAVWRGETPRAIELLEEARGRLREPDDPLCTRELYAIGARAYADEAERVRGRRVAVADALRARAAELAARARYAALPNGTVELAETQAFQAQADAEVRRIDAAPDEAEAWRAVAQRWCDLRLGWREAYCRWREAAAWLSRDERQAALAALERGHAIASEIGAGSVLGAIERLAARARMRLGTRTAAAPAPASTAPHGLTARETEVLALLAQGMTNRQIAGQLYISEKTAGVHVSNILAKLDVVSRAQAAALAVQSGYVAIGT